LESDSGQQANELADIIAVRKFPDGSNMLEYLHNNGHLKKVATNMVIVMPNSTTQIPLDELNKLIAQQKGITLEELAIVPEGEVTPEPVAEVPAEYKNKWDKARAEKAAKLEAEQAAKTTSASVTAKPEVVAVAEAATPEEQAKLYRSQADKLAKQAAEMRRKAEELVPTTKKKTKAEA
jgi:hypothetical protein